MVQGIVRDHGGIIDLISTPGGGTTFRIFLLYANEAAPSSLAAIAPTPLKEDRPPSGSILIVENEDALRLAVSQMLRRRGFCVIEVSDGSSALEELRGYKGRLDVMLLDLTLPGVSSREVFEGARQIHPNLKVILTSAYSREMVDDYFRELPVSAFIRKPFQLAELIELIQDTLSG